MQKCLSKAILYPGKTSVFSKSSAINDPVQWPFYVILVTVTNTVKSFVQWDLSEDDLYPRISGVRKRQHSVVKKLATYEERDLGQISNSMNLSLFIFNNKHNNTFQDHGESSGRKYGKVLCDLKYDIPAEVNTTAPDYIWSLPVLQNARPWHCLFMRLTVSSINIIKQNLLF